MKNVLIDSQLSNKINDYVYQYARENLISKWTIGSTDKDICQAILESCTIVGMTKISEAPLVDSLMNELGIKGGDISSFTNSLTETK